MQQIDANIQATWPLFFPFDPYDANTDWTNAARLFCGFFLSDAGRALLGKTDLDCAVHVTFDYAQFCASLTPSLNGFNEVLHSNASTTLACLGLALCSLRRQHVPLEHVAARMRPITARFVNVRPLTAFTSLKADLIGKFVALKGNVVRVCGVRPLVLCMSFRCTKCQAVMTKNLPDGKFEPPTACESGRCRGKTFEPILESAKTVDLQRIKIQEIIEDDVFDLDADGAAERPADGRVPRTINVELMEELVDLCVPGDVVVVSGTVKALNTESIEGQGARAKGKGREAGLLLLLIEANALESGRAQRVDAAAANDQGDDKAEADESVNIEQSDVVASLTPADLAAIAQVARQRDFGLLVYSLCPLIFGHDDVKAGLLLGLLGGSANPGVRADAHILVVGEPGMGKSQMLRSAALVAPRGVYVCGNTTSATGLTVTLSKDASGEHSLEAGALVLADRGACCIDEFDKMGNQHAALLEAMEQQSVSVAKAGVVCSVCARAVVLAAANPKAGHYRRDKSLLENIAIDAPLLSRFDVVFLMLDRPDERRDDVLAKNVLAMHARKGSAAATSRQRAAALSSPLPQQPTTTDDKPFRERIADAVATHAASREPLSSSLLRKYIAYCRQHVHPVLSLQACKVIQAFYLELRHKGNRSKSVPITTRQLESLVRLAQARARAEMRDVVTESDALDIVSLMEGSLMDALTDDLGRVDLTRSGGMSQSKLQKAFIEQLKKAVDRRLNPFFTMAELQQEARQAGLLQQISDFTDFLERLSDHCFVLKKPGGYQLSRTVHGMTQSSQASQQWHTSSQSSAARRR